MLVAHVYEIWRSRARALSDVKHAADEGAGHSQQVRLSSLSCDEYAADGVHRQRHIPKPIHSAQKTRREMLEAERTREENRRAHAPRNLPQTKPKAERKKGILRVQE